MFSFKGIDFYRPRVEDVLKFDSATSDPCMFFKIVDDWSAQDFAKNYGGHPRSDVALLEEQTDLSFVQQ